MKPSELRLGFLLLILLASSHQTIYARQSSSEEAYVTLLYGDEFLLGVRVLGKSIRDTGSTTKDMVVLVSDGVSDYAKKLLKVSIFYSFSQNIFRSGI